MLDTHYAHPEDATEEYEVAGERFRFRRYDEHGRADVFSGVRPTSKWLRLDDIERVLREAGFGTVEVVEKRDERNGPRVLLFAEPELERPAHEPPVGGDQRIRRADGGGDRDHPGPQNRRQRGGQLAVGHPAQALRLAPLADEPTRVADAPPPAAQLAAKPALLRRQSRPSPPPRRTGPARAEPGAPASSP